MAGRKFRSAAVVTLLLAGLLVAGRPLVAHAAAFTVNTTADTHDAAQGDGACADSMGHCSLRAAIEEANAATSGDTITLPAGAYVLSLGGLTISNPNLTLNGAGASTTIIDGNHQSSVTVLFVTIPGGLHLFGVTIQNGTNSGMFDSGTLTVDSSVFANNVTSSGGPEGGGLAIEPGAVATVINSRFTGNSQTGVSGIGGGGIANRAGTLTLMSSTIDHNTAVAAGGCLGLGGQSTLINDTITANSSTGGGGGGISSSTAPVTIENSTIDANSAVNYGGGIEAYSGTTKYVQFKNTIISGNSAGSNGANCFGGLGIQSNGYNIDGDTSCPFSSTGDQQSTNPQLGALQNNGGLTPTQAIVTGSPAVDHGSPDCPPPSTDQRGSPRPIGPACDVGAYEYLPFPSASLPAVMNNAYGGYSTAAYVKNTGSLPAAVNIIYYDQNGAFVGMDWTPNLAPNATWTVPQTNGHSFTSGNAGSAIVYSSQPIASFVNEFHGSLDASSYTGIPILFGGSTTLWAPTIVNNAYGGYTTGIGLINQSPATTDVTVTYRDGAGSLVATQTLTGVAPHAYRGLYSGDPALALPSGFAGTATLSSSSGQISAVVNETGPGGQFSSYDAVSSSSVFLYAPAALNNAYGGYFTGMGIQNPNGTATTAGVTYYDATGAQAGTAKNFSLPAYGYVGVYQGSATDGPPPGAYTARITSVMPIVAIVNETAPSTGPSQQSTGYNTLPAGASSLNLPLVESAGTDGWSTGEGIMNTGSAATTVTVTYYDTTTGATVGTPQVTSLPQFAFWGLYQPAGGLSNGARASAVVTTSSGGQVAVICNESSSTSFMSYVGQ